MIIKERLGWIKEEQIKIVSSDETVKLVQRELPVAGVKAIKIFAGEENGYSKWYVFEYHTPLGFDEQNNHVVLLNFYYTWGYVGPRANETVLLEREGELPLDLKKEFCDSRIGLTVRVVGEGGWGAEAWAELEITLLETPPPPPPCIYSVSPTSQSFSASGGAGSVDVTASSDSCSWTAVSNEDWIVITSGSSGAGNGTVAYSVSANTGTSARTGIMNIAGETFTVNQDPPPQICEAESIFVSPKTLSLSLKKKKRRYVTVTVAGADGCAVEGEMVTATTSKAGATLVSISPKSAMTDENGEAVFTITVKKKTGRTTVYFQAQAGDLESLTRIKITK